MLSLAYNKQNILFSSKIENRGIKNSKIKNLDIYPNKWSACGRIYKSFAVKSQAPHSAVARSVATMSSAPGSGWTACCINTTAIFVLLPSRAALKEISYHLV